MEAFITKRDEYPVDRSEAIAILNNYDKKKPNVQPASEGTAFTQKEKKVTRITKARREHPIRRGHMKRRATNQRRIGLPKRLAICVAKQATALISVQKEAPKKMTICLSREAAQTEAPRRVLPSLRRK